MLLQELRARTQPSHDRLEAVVDIIGRCRERARYRRLLEQFYGFYAPLEAALAAAPLPASVAFERRRKTPLLVRDLHALTPPGPSPSELPLCRALPHVNTLPSALGCLYVLEGATLGGQIIARHLAAGGLGPNTGAAFFHSYGPDVGRLWKSFGRALTEAVTDRPAQETAIASACETFAALELTGWHRSFPMADSKTGEQVDLTHCDREPIHIPGAVQPHGALLALDPADLTVLQVSDNLGVLLGTPPPDALGRPAGSLLGDAAAERLRQALRQPDPSAMNPLALTVPVGGATGRSTASCTAATALLVMELEPAAGCVRGRQRLFRFYHRSRARWPGCSGRTACCTCARSPWRKSAA